MVLVRDQSSDYEVKQVDQDGLWKKVIGDLFEEFLQFFMPELHAEVDFTQVIEFLEKELYQEIIDQKKGRRYTDRLVKVQLKNGEEKWVLVHVEVQGSHEADFSFRMFQYYYRILDQYGKKIIALAIHTGLNQIEDMKFFAYDYFGTTLTYSYNNYRIEDYSDEELERSDNIFSRVVLAVKAVHDTKDEVEKRYQFKQKLIWDLIKNKKYPRTAVIATIYFIDYLLQLPEEETKKLGRELSKVIRKEQGLMELYNEDNAPPTVKISFAERIEKSIEQGIEQGIEKGLEQGLEQGILQEKQNVAKNLLQENMSKELIIQVTGLSMEAILKLEQQEE